MAHIDHSPLCKLNKNSDTQVHAFLRLINVSVIKIKWKREFLLE